MHKPGRLTPLPWFLALLDATDEAIASTTLDGRIVTWNAAAERLFGYRCDEVVDEHVSLLAPPDRAGEFEGLLERIAAGERVERHRTICVRRGGDLLHTLLVLGPMRDEHGEVVGAIVIAWDLAVGGAREKARREARRLQELGLVAGGVAHDFNNLLTAVLGYGHLALEGATGEIRTMVEEMLQAAAQAGELARQLLEYTRQTPRPPELLELDGAVLAVAGVLHRLLAGRAELVVVPAQEPLPPVEINRIHLQQVVVNLVLNARDAMPNGGRVTVSTSVAEPEQPGLPRHVVLSVADEGTGMDEETRQHLFEPFFTTKAAGGGTGLGLATAHGIVEQAGGHIAVTTSPGNGTVFTVYLPAGTNRAERLPTAA
jgi:PAS domain S-box-containing protein